MSDFARNWQEITNEKSDTQKFWLSFIRDILGIPFPERYIKFEVPVQLEHKSFIDAYIPSTGIIIEQKSPSISLDVPAQQSNGTSVTPFEQAKRYYDWLPKSQKGNYIIVSNFREFRIHDMEDPHAEPRIILLKDIEREKDKLAFIVKPDRIYTREELISIQAGYLARKLRDELRTRYVNPDEKSSKRSLNVFCVRVVFLLYAEDSGLLKKSQFYYYLKSRAKTARTSLIELFRTLNIQKSERDPYLDAELKAFPYINGGLFADSNIEIPQIDGEPLRIILQDMSEGFDWSGISPTIFGAIFERILSDEERHDEGIHYTSIENIHKVIDPLFMDALNGEFEAITGCEQRPGTLQAEVFEAETSQVQEFATESLKTGASQVKVFRTETPQALTTGTLKTGASQAEVFKTETPQVQALKPRTERSKSGTISQADMRKKLLALQVKLTSLKFFDPACGSGNFLTETYLSLCRLEHKIINALGTFAFLQVSIEQFYGIEINDFAVDVAKTALWIAQIQMFREVNPNDKPDEKLLPLTKTPNIYEANALKSNWPGIVKPDENLFIISNPPFLGYTNQNPAQKKEIAEVYKGDYDRAGKIDYVSGWYYKASEFMQNVRTKAAFLSTNSVTQGEQVTFVWKPLMKKLGIHIDFAHTAFKWKNESAPADQAHVHVVVVGFSHADKPGTLRKLYTPSGLRLVENINAYLVAAPNVFAEARNNAICDFAPVMLSGSMPRDGGNLIMTFEELQELLRTDPLAEKLIRPLMGGNDFLQRKPRYCLWLLDADPEVIMKCPRVMERIKRVKEFRLASKRPGTRKDAKTPALFAEIRYSKSNYIAIPQVSSEKRYYIPIDWLPPEVIPTSQLKIIPDATLYDFGVLTSRVHMGWMRIVCGRLGVTYRYSNTIVYNDFVWPEVNEKQRAKIEATARGILEARAKFPESSFAALYKDEIMPLELRRAHERNDEAVCAAYGWRRDIAEEDVVMRLFEKYYALKGEEI